MKLFDLPISTEINRVVPKNSFDGYTTSKHRKRFSELVDKIKWTNKLSTQTVNLIGKDVYEIQIFHVDLKHKANVSDLLDIIDKAIPYNIIFIVRFEDEYYLRAAAKHAHPTNENTTVIDWVFCSNWLGSECPFKLTLKANLDAVWTDICQQLSGKVASKVSINKLVGYQQRLAILKKDITRLEVALKQARQFNRKVELNLELQSKLQELQQVEADFS